MFKSVDYTGTYYQGCNHNCIYCWTKFMRGGPISHKPRLMQHDEFEQLKIRDATIFLQSAHDSFAICIPATWIRAMLRWISRQHPSITFYLQSKNISRAYSEFLPELTKIRNRIILGTTIETNRQGIIDKISKAPTIFSRAEAMTLFAIRGFRTRISHEPLFLFDVEEMLRIDLHIRPKIIEVGLDNYAHRHGHEIPQPVFEDYLELQAQLVRVGITVNEKTSIKKWRRSQDERV